MSLLCLLIHFVPTYELFALLSFQYTHNGKKVEVAVKKVISGEEFKVRGAYANPNSIDLYTNIPELQGY